MVDFFLLSLNLSSYRDFSCVPPEEGYKECGSIEEMTFAQKVHHMLSQPQYNYMIAWVPAHGRAWRVLRPSDFERNVMPNYFGHSRYSNFLSMIRQNGFKCLTLGPDKGCLYHEVRKERRRLCKQARKFSRM
jgi:HSF-type DNA-binding